SPSVSASLSTFPNRSSLLQTIFAAGLDAMNKHRLNAKPFTTLLARTNEVLECSTGQPNAARSSLVGGAVVGHLETRAQQPSMPVVGYLGAQHLKRSEAPGGLWYPAAVTEPKPKFISSTWCLKNEPTNRMSVRRTRRGLLSATTRMRWLIARASETRRASESPFGTWSPCLASIRPRCDRHASPRSVWR